MSQGDAPVPPRWRLSHGGVAIGGAARGVRFLLGVPFARAPEGEARLALPSTDPGWEGERDCTQPGPVAPQWPRGGQGVVGSAACLCLNVWLPEGAPPAEGWPVLVWVHGGGYIRGSASESLYDGATFARAGIVVVLLQYRLGMDGFMDLPGVPANRGLHDIVAGLRWVQREVSGLGGDLARVTLAGQSAGAGAIACVASLPSARGLFTQLLLQSPSVTCHTLQDAALAREAIAAVLGVPATRQALLAAPVGDVVKAVQQLAADPALRQRHGLGARHFFPLRPVIDGEWLTDAPVAALRRAWAQGAAPQAVLVGANAEEMRLYHVPSGALARMTARDLTEFVQQMGLSPQVLAECLAADDPGERLCQLQTDGYYRAPARHLAAAASAAHRPAFLYDFAWRSPQCDGKLGAAHGVELPFVFATLDTAMGRELAGAAPPKALSQAMQAAWVRFVKQADPGWPSYTHLQPWSQQFNAQSRCVCLPQDDPRLAIWA